MEFLFLINSGLRFLLEIASVLILIIIGFSKNKFPLNIFIGAILPAIFVGLWSIFVAPASPNRASLSIRLGIELIIYISTALVIRKDHSTKGAILYFVFAIVNSGLNIVGDKLCR